VGFSTSGSALVVFAAMFIALGAIHSSSSIAVEEINAAEQAQISHSLTIQETSMNITNATHNTTADVVTIKATNTGERPLDVDDVTVVADAGFVPRAAFESVTVAGRDSRIWLPGEELVLQDEDGTIAGLVDGTSPNYVKLVTRDGVAALSEVTLRG
jgi:archaellum component FlaF (FlaF/FlaG flagellin family)